MLTKSLIAAAALAALTAGMASTAEAKIKINGHINLGMPYYPVYDAGYHGGYYDDDYYGGGGCFTKPVKKLKWHDHGGFMHKHIKWKNELVCY